MWSPGWTGCNRVVSPFSSPNPARPKFAFMKRTHTRSIHSSTRLFVSNCFLGAFVGRICVTSAEEETQVCVRVCTRVCVSVVSHQQYVGRRCQMCPCYIIDDGGKVVCGGVRSVIYSLFQWLWLITRPPLTFSPVSFRIFILIKSSTRKYGN